MGVAPAELVLDGGRPVGEHQRHRPRPDGGGRLGHVDDDRGTAGLEPVDDRADEATDERPPPRRGRRLTAGEARLWDAIAKLVTPLPGRAPPAPEIPPNPVMPAATMPALTAPILKPSAPPVAKRPRAKSPPRPAPELPRPATAAPYHAPPQRHAPSLGLERTAKVGLRRGRLAIEARIDLHGMVQAEAHAALTGFLLRARAVAIFPGGFGTLDEFFETLTLIQTGRMDRIPVLLFGIEFWRKVIDFEALAEAGTIGPDDPELFTAVDSAEEGWNVIREHYNLPAVSLPEWVDGAVAE